MPESMTALTTRAAVLVESGRPAPFGSSRPIEIIDVDLAAPRATELLVRVEAAGVCHSDLSVVDGSRLRPLPMVLGHEAAGLVVEVGSAVEDIAVGQRVVLVFVPSCGDCSMCRSGRPALCTRAKQANGEGSLLGGGSRLSVDGRRVQHHLGVSGFSELAVVDRASVVPVPDDVPPGVAAMFGCALLTGVGAVRHSGHLRAGETVGVWGLGGVGLSAMLGAVAAGAERVVVFDPAESKRELARRLGATDVLEPGQDLRDVLPDGVDLAVEAVGRAAALRAAFDATAVGGRTVTAGLPAPGQLLELPALTIVAEARTLIGSYMGDAHPPEDIATFVEWWRAGTLPVEALCSGELGLDGLNEAMDRLADGSAVRQIVRP